MSMSTYRPVCGPGVATPTRAGRAPRRPGGGPGDVVDVLFPLVDDEEWPPYPAETIDAVLIAHDLAEIRGHPVVRHRNQPRGHRAGAP